MDTNEISDTKDVVMETRKSGVRCVQIPEVLLSKKNEDSSNRFWLFGELSWELGGHLSQHTLYKSVIFFTKLTLKCNFTLTYILSDQPEFWCPCLIFEISCSFYLSNEICNYFSLAQTFFHIVAHYYLID